MFRAEDVLAHWAAANGVAGLRSQARSSDTKVYALFLSAIL